MKRIFGILLLVAALMLASGASADEKDLYIDRNVQKIFTSEDGLLSTSTQAVAQTREGFIWIGGYGGLVRYDGKRFETFAYKRITRVSGLAAGEDGALWVATSDKGVFRYMDHEFTPVPVEDGNAALDVECMAFAPDGTLYLGTGSGLCAVQDGVARRLDIPGLNGQHIDRLLCPETGAVLCVTRTGDLLRYDGATLQRSAAGDDYAVRSVCVDAATGAYLAGTSGNEVLALDGDLNVTAVTPMEGLSCINDLHCDANGALWLCADNGIAVYTHGSVRMQNLLMNNSVDQMMVDHEGNYWFVSSRQGVLEVSRSQFGDVSRSAGLESMVVNAIQRIGDTLYIGHDSGLVSVDATDFKRSEDAPLPTLKGTRVRALLADSGDNLWIGTMKKGLIRYAPDGEVARYTGAEYPALRSDNIRSIVETDEGMLIGTDVGAYLVNGEDVRSAVNDADAVAFRILCADRFGDTLYLGSDGNGLYLVRDGEIVRRVTTGDGLSSNVIMKQYWSEAFDGVWLVTGNNIDFLAADGSVTSIDNFPSTNNLDLLLMQNGDAWVFTGSGIYQTTEESLLRDAEPRYQQYRRADGLPYEITPNSYQCVTEDVLYGCGSGGVFSLETDFMQSEAEGYQLVIDSVIADGQPVYIQSDGACDIEDEVRRIDINAYVLTYQTGNPQVIYWLEGFDEGETIARLSQLGHISYTNLNGGSYTFHFGVRDYKSDAVLQETTLHIVKKYPWYQKPAVRVAAVALGLLLLGLVALAIIRARYRRVTRTLQKEYERKEKEHLENMAYRDFLTGLYNRNYLDVWNARLAPDAAYPISFVSIDMNNLKLINDRYGHKNGDQLLCAMADLLKKYFSGEQYSVLRIGGDEFLVLARGVDEAEMTGILERMAEEGNAVFVNGVPVTFGYGICSQREGEYNFEDGLRLSDLKLLEQKDRIHGRKG